ncbi:MAG TPA: hypothetical protein VMT29_06485 [Steroidobacteraceae bacterium]|nr:hypothetical protein [Steroidobacteraceae bacterium]
MRIPNRLPVPLVQQQVGAAAAAPAPALPTEEAAGKGLSITQILTILRAWWKQSAIIAVIVICVTAVVVKYMPKLYTASATLMISYEVNDPLGGKEFPLQLLASYMATQMEIMLSPEVMFGVVDDLKLTQEKEFAAGYRPTDGTSLRDWVKDQVTKGATVTQGNFGSQLIYIKASARNPVMAANIANSIANTYLKQHLERRTGPASVRAGRYEEQLADLKKRVEDAQQKIAEFRDRTGVTDLTAVGNDGEQQLLTSLEEHYQVAQNARRAAEVKQSDSHSSSDQVVNSQLVQGLRAQLSKQESDLAQQRTTLGAMHPRVLELQSQIEATRQSIQDAIRSYSGSASVELSEARALEEKLRRAVEEQRAKVVKLRNVQDEGTSLRLELDAAQSAYRKALDSHEEIAASTKDSYSDVHLVTQAQPPPKADKPNKIKLMLMGILAGIGLGLVIPAAYELLLNRRIRCRDDIERDLGIDVLVELNSIRHQASPA